MTFTIPRTRLEQVNNGFIIKLECKCGEELDYPGHPPDNTVIQCEYCFTNWVVK